MVNEAEIELKKPETLPEPVEGAEDNVEQKEELNSPEKIRADLMEGYNRNLLELTEAMDRNRQLEKARGEVDEKNQEKMRHPLVTVIVSLWEETPDMITTKMFKHSITDLTRQARESGINLDIICVANNGGGANEELGNKLREEMSTFFEENSETLGITKPVYLETEQPEEDPKAGTPWKLDIPTTSDEDEKRTDNRIFFVNQPYTGKDGVNAGKLRGVRDVTHSLAKEVKQNDYVTDGIFQIDAETVLEYKEGTADKADKTIPPLKTLFNNLTRRNLTAVGTKDRLEAIDPETGKPVDAPRPTAQEGFVLTNTREKFISLPGGALLSKPENYIAAMQSMTEVTPSTGCEDYMYTQMLKTQAEKDGKPFEEVAASMDIVTHLNRTPEDNKKAVKQMLRWRQQAMAIDKVFPNLEPYQTESILRYAYLVTKERVKKSWKGKRTDYLKQVLKDFAAIPDIIGMVTDKEASDILKGSASWGHGQAKEKN